MYVHAIWIWCCVNINGNRYIVFRAGEQGRFWYAVLGGSLEVRYHAADTDNKVSETNGLLYRCARGDTVDMIITTGYNLKFDVENRAKRQRLLGVK